MTAVPSAGYRFEKWSGSIGNTTADNATIKIVMDVDRSITADFVWTSTTSTPEENVSLQIKCTVNGLGILQNNVSSSSLADTVTINVAKGTELLSASGNPVTQISVTSTTPPAEPPEGYHIIKSFNFKPDNAQFDPGITVTVSFDASAVADGETVVLASYNATKSEWEMINGKDNGNGTATFTIKHFSTYSLMSSSAEKTSSNVVLWVIIGIAVIALIALLVIKFTSRKAKRPDDFMPLS